jgi:hypothetical protein
MLFFFDIFHNGELHLDERAKEFASLDDAHDHLIDTLREFIRLGGHPSDFIGPDAAIDITDRVHVRRIVAMSSVMDELAVPIQQAA